MKILVCGGRAFNNRELFASAMADYAVKATRIIHGAAGGADTMAGVWARANGIAEVACPADWERYGRAAGPIRNAEMLERYVPDLVIAFPGGRGTADMVRRATRARIPVIQIKH
jgi:hypothetical protein